MHYIPESAREFLQDETSLVGTMPSDEAGFHYRSAPIYLLTALVGLLLGCDLVVGARPEHFEDADLVDAGEGTVTFDATVELVEWLGNELVVHFGIDAEVPGHLRELGEELELEELTNEDRIAVVARLDADSGATEGDTIRMVLDTSEVLLFDAATGDRLHA